MGAPKGHPAWSKGRPPGSKNKNYLDPNFWTAKLYEVYEKATEKEKGEMAFRLLTMLFSKMQVLPKSPEESVNNVNALVLDALKSGQVKIENAKDTEAEPRPIPAGN